MWNSTGSNDPAEVQGLCMRLLSDEATEIVGRDMLHARNPRRSGGGGGLRLHRRRGERRVSGAQTGGNGRTEVLLLLQLRGLTGLVVHRLFVVALQ